MKHYRWLLLLLMWGCNQDTIDPRYPGQVEGIHNGKKWLKPKLLVGTARYCSPIDIGFLVDAQTEYKDVIERLSVRGISVNTGTYKVKTDDYTRSCQNIVTDLTWNVYDDTNGDYEVIENGREKNEINITKVDTIANVIEGSFDISYTIKFRRFKYLPDTIRVQANFKSPIFKK